MGQLFQELLTPRELPYTKGPVLTSSSVFKQTLDFFLGGSQGLDLSPILQILKSCCPNFERFFFSNSRVFEPSF
jgi:hypothetical protein